MVYNTWAGISATRQGSPDDLRRHQIYKVDHLRNALRNKRVRDEKGVVSYVVTGAPYEVIAVAAIVVGGYLNQPVTGLSRGQKIRVPFETLRNWEIQV